MYQPKQDKPFQYTRSPAQSKDIVVITRKRSLIILIARRIFLGSRRSLRRRTDGLSWQYSITPPGSIPLSDRFSLGMLPLNSKQIYKRTNKHKHSPMVTAHVVPASWSATSWSAVVCQQWLYPSRSPRVTQIRSQRPWTLSSKAMA